MKRTHTIGFDAKYANAELSGMGSYGRFITRALATACTENECNDVEVEKSHE